MSALLNYAGELSRGHEADYYILLVLRICSFGVSITTLECLFRPGFLKQSGLASWRISRLDHAWQSRGVSGRVLDIFLCYPNILGVLGLRLGVAVLMTAGPDTLILNPILISLAALLTLAMTIRSPYALDGSDQVATLIYVGLGIVTIAPTSLTKHAYLTFLAIQVCLSYIIAGVAKLISHGWRNGTFLSGILCIKSYCSPSTARFARDHRSLLWIASWGVIGWECLFVFILVIPLRYSLPLLCAGIAFHVVIAFVMGLNNFVWAFTAMYPGLLFCLTLRGW